jgi:hypothetical protein
MCGSRTYPSWTIRTSVVLRLVDEVGGQLEFVVPDEAVNRMGVQTVRGYHGALTTELEASKTRPT